jgi:hypothetical protein
VVDPTVYQTYCSEELLCSIHMYPSRAPQYSERLQFLLCQPFSHMIELRRQRRPSQRQPKMGPIRPALHQLQLTGEVSRDSCCDSEPKSSALRGVELADAERREYEFLLFG